MSVVLAHQGGWDEAVMVVVPVVLLAGLLWIANGRAKAKLAQQQQAEREDDPPG